MTTMTSLPMGVRIVLCASLSILLIKVISDRQQFAWYSNRLANSEVDKCSDLALGPEPHLDWPTWAPFADTLAKEVKEADKAQGYDVVFYGDSITEQWRGSAIGARYPDLKETHEIFDAYFNKNFSSHVLAIAGDQVGHLWWRLLNGEIFLRQPPKVAVILIGTNDLTADDCHQTEAASLETVVGIVSRVREMLWLLRSKSPETQIVLVGILPRDAHISSGPPTYEWPNRMTNPIALANFEYESMAASDERTHFIDCGSPYVLSGGRGLDHSLIPDALHPNAAGMEQMAKCLQPLIDSLALAPGPAAAVTTEVTAEGS